MPRKLELDSLVIEVTRRCFLKCDHCLRGNAQLLSLPIHHADTLFEKVGYVSSLTFTGGEPALVPGLLQQIRHSVEKHNTEIGNFYIATSTAAPENTFKNFVIECLEWHLLCNDNDTSQVNWSNDSFHELNPHNVALLKLLSFASPKYDPKFLDTVEHNLIDEGRAVSNGWGTRPPSDDDFIFDDDGRFTEGTLYLNCIGEMISGCDWSYLNQRKHKICNVDDLTIEAIQKYQSSKKGGENLP